MSDVVVPPTARPRPFAAVATFVVVLIGGAVVRNPWPRMGWGRGRDKGMMPSAPAVTTPLLVFGLFASALGIAVWFAPRFPRAAYGCILALTAGYLVAGGPLPAALLAPAFALATLLRRRPSGEALGWVALLVPAFAALALRDPTAFLDDPLPTLGLVLFGVAWALLPATVATSIAGRRAAAAERRADELERAAYEERLRVARDIHDVVGHSLSMISLQSGVALHVLDSDPSQVRASLEAIRDSSKSSLAELRQTLGVFRDSAAGEPLAPTPSLAAVPGLVASVKAGGRVVGLAMAPDAAEGVPATVQTVAYRVVQEALTNVVRHAGTASAGVSIERRPVGLAVVVRDDGTATSAPVEGNGLRGMRERAESVGGRLTVDVRPGGGLAVEAVLPIGGHDE